MKPNWLSQQLKGIVDTELLLIKNILFYTRNQSNLFCLNMKVSLKIEFKVNQTFFLIVIFTIISFKRKNILISFNI